MKKIIFTLFILLISTGAYAQCSNAATTPTAVTTSPQTICEGDANPAFSATCAGSCATPCLYNDANCSVVLTIEVCHSYIGDLNEWHIIGPGGTDFDFDGGNMGGGGGTGNGGTCTGPTSGAGETFIFTFDSESANTMGNVNPVSGSIYELVGEAGLNGEDINAAGWAVAVYDCVGADDGDLISVSITFDCTGNGCDAGAETTTYTLNTPAEIADGSCAAATAATVVVPPAALPEQVWYSAATGGTPLNATDAAYTPTDSAPGTYPYYVQCACGPSVPPGDCPSPREQVDLIIVDVPTISAVGSCTVDAPGNGEIIITEGAAAINGSWQYSIDGGATWQPSGTFSSLANGTYPVAISNTLDATCIVTDAAIVINCQEPPCDAATGTY